VIESDTLATNNSWTFPQRFRSKRLTLKSLADGDSDIALFRGLAFICSSRHLLSMAPRLDNVPWSALVPLVALMWHEHGWPVEFVPAHTLSLGDSVSALATPPDALNGLSLCRACDDVGEIVLGTRWRVNCNFGVVCVENARCEPAWPTVLTCEELHHNERSLNASGVHSFARGAHKIVWASHERGISFVLKRMITKDASKHSGLDAGHIVHGRRKHEKHKQFTDDDEDDVPIAVDNLRTSKKKFDRQLNWAVSLQNRFFPNALLPNAHLAQIYGGCGDDSADNPTLIAMEGPLLPWGYAGMSGARWDKKNASLFSFMISFSEKS
jgi:hypothetical protein